MFVIRREQAVAADNTLATLPHRFASELRRRGMKLDEETCDRVVVADAAGARTTQSFSSDGAPSTTILPSGREIHYVHANRNPFSEIRYPSGEHVRVGFDGNGDLTSVEGPGDVAYRFAYDEKRRATKICYPDRTSRRFSYGPGGLERVEDRTGGVTSFACDDVAGWSEITDPLGRSTRFMTDPRGRLQRLVYADGTEQVYSYAEDGALRQVRRRDGAVVGLEPRGRDGARLCWPDGTHTQIRAFGPSFTVENETDAITLIYDERRRPLGEVSACGAVEYEYDAEGRLTAIKDPWNGRVDYRYDADGRLHAVDWDGVEVRVEHTPLGAVSSIHYGKAAIERREVGRMGLRLNSCLIAAETGERRCEQVYSYDKCDRLVRHAERRSDGTWHQRRLTHDAEGRLLAETDASTGETRYEYRYDAKGNLSFDCGGEVRRGAMDEPIAHKGRRLVYDPLGNATRIPGRAREDLRCVWRGDGSLAEVRSERALVTFRYDALGRRIEKSVGGSTWRFGWAGDRLLWEESETHPGARRVRRDYLYLPDGTPLAFREDGRTFWLQTDPRGAVVCAFDDAGAVVWRGHYEPFGAVRVEISEIRQPLRFLGQYEDDETGLYYNVARYYCPWLKTYISLDPNWLQHGATNYSYACNDPWNRNDPNGALAPLVIIAIGGLVGAGLSALSAYFYGHGSILGAALNGFITGALTTAGFLVGGPWGALAGGAIGSFFGTLVEGAMNGQGWCWECASRAALISVAVDLLLMGLGRIPAVKQALAKAAGQLDDFLRKLGILRPKPSELPPIWNSVKATQPVYEGTVIPRSFELATASGDFWVHGNASEHLAEYAESMLKKGVSPDLVHLASQQQLQSLQAAVESATAKGVPYDDVITVGGWELKFGRPRVEGQLPVLIHALPR